MQEKGTLLRHAVSLLASFSDDDGRFLPHCEVLHFVQTAKDHMSLRIRQRKIRTHVLSVSNLNDENLVGCRLMSDLAGKVSSRHLRRFRRFGDTCDAIVSGEPGYSGQGSYFSQPTPVIASLSRSGVIKKRAISTLLK